ncbi:hypothetical protein F4553_006396 [Allocatelliglobosispora scoriae]|uniref:Uncharacterized protein n=1 Tax=Allocatelliglobosispora scoriae TaxID=643052 RepID=A0A841C1M5_9ACTN|nr:hypothetical protein [Allocatelliglobosispora scoriae]MBB5872962.1 hypothetical protein [Allocatelliglobosispora scoriae]
MPALTRGQKILAAVAVVIIALFVTGVATQGDDGEVTVDPTQNGLVKMLGGWFGSPDQAELGELTAPCLTESVLAIEGSCVLTVKGSDKDLREVLLQPDQALQLHTRAPHDDAVLDKDVEAGKEIKVAVDGDGVDITLSCEKCTVKVGGDNG